MTEDGGVDTSNFLSIGVLDIYGFEVFETNGEWMFPCIFYRQV